MIGTTTADEQRIRTDLGFESGSILEIKGRMELRLEELKSENEIREQAAAQDEKIEALERDLKDKKKNTKSPWLASEDVGSTRSSRLVRPRRQPHHQDPEDPRALEQKHNAKLRRLQEDIDTKGRDNQC